MNKKRRSDNDDDKKFKKGKEMFCSLDEILSKERKRGQWNLTS